MVFCTGWPTIIFTQSVTVRFVGGGGGWRLVVWHWCSGSVCPEGVYKHVALDGIFLYYSLSLTLSIIIYYHYYCTNQPAGRSFHFPNVVNRQTERNPCGKQRLRHCQLTCKTTTHPMNITDIDMYISLNIIIQSRRHLQCSKLLSTTEGVLIICY